MLSQARFSLAEAEQVVCDVTSRQLGIARTRISPASRLIEDLHCDSLDLVELIMEIEEAFSVTIPQHAPNPAYKAVFTRQPFRLSDLAELVYLQRETGAPERNRKGLSKTQPSSAPAIPFMQLGSTWQPAESDGQLLLEPLDTKVPALQFRRRSDGMRCVLIPSASVEIGSDTPDALPDEQPQHVVQVDSFLIDAEPVSTTAYCRFLNSIHAVSSKVLTDWFVLDPQDDRSAHMPIGRMDQGWQPISGAERWPMILVSWYGANAYSLWANGRDWKNYLDDETSFLPTEAQWEYAARGSRSQPFPRGDLSSTEPMCYGRHRRGATYRADTLPMADVNELLGMSPFGLHHMAGNVWQWCRDWYEEGFFGRAEARQTNPVNTTPGKVRSERGGSWIGPAELCRSSYRRGRPPFARGRCLGFRCVSAVEKQSGG